jgi:hypothetical protein
MAKNSLPTFSGNYGSQGQYEKVQKPAIDQSSLYKDQGITKGLNEITKGFTDYFAKQSAATAAAKMIVDENYKFGETQKEKLLWQLGKQGINNESLYALGYKLIDAQTQSSLKVKQAKTPEEKAALMKNQNFYGKKLGEFLGLVNTMKDSMSTYSTDGNLEGKVGDQGQVATVGLPYTPKYNLGMPALIGLADGADSEFYMDKGGDFRIRMNSNQIKKGAKNGYLDENASVFLSFDPGRVPKLKKLINDKLIASKVFDKNLKLNETYSQRVNKLDGDFTVTEEITNMDGIKSLSNTTINPLRDSMLSDPKNAQIIWKQIWNQDGELEIADGSENSTNKSVFTTESEKKWLDKWDEYVYGSASGVQGIIPSTRVVDKKLTGSDLTDTEKKDNKNQSQAEIEASKLIAGITSGDSNKVASYLGGKTINKKRIQPNSIKLTEKLGPFENDQAGGNVLDFNIIEGTSVTAAGTTYGTSAKGMNTFDLSNPDRVSDLIKKIIEKGTYGVDKKLIMTEVNKLLGINEKIDNPLLD